MNDLIDQALQNSNMLMKGGSNSGTRSPNSGFFKVLSPYDDVRNNSPYNKCDPYNDNRVVKVRSSRIGNYATSYQEYFVKYQGSMENVIKCSHMFLKDLEKRVRNEKTGDVGLTAHKNDEESWTKSSLGNYLKHMWIKLLEQEKIVFIDLSKNEMDKAEYGDKGIGQYCYLFNPKLCDVKNGYKPIIILAVQQDYKRFSEPMTLIYNVSILHIDDPKINRLMRSKVKGKLEHVIFEKPLKYDNNIWIKIKDKHIIGENVDRLVAAELIDPYEVETMNSNNSYSDEETDRHSKKLSDDENSVMYNKVIIKKEDDGRYLLRRKFCGHRAILNALNVLIQRTQTLVNTYGEDSLTTPYLYYEKEFGDEKVFRSSCQLIMPLFDEDMNAKLALSIVRTGDTYNAHYGFTFERCISQC